MPVFRPAVFKFEAMMLGILGGYLLLHLLGKSFNNNRAKAALAPYVPLLESQFSLVKPMVSSSSALHLIYATGRRNVLCAHVTLTLKPFHDILQLIFGTIMSVIEPTRDDAESLTVTLTLGRGTSGLQDVGAGVWAILNKAGMANIREKRFDLTFPRLHESTAVPVTHALFSEHSDITDALLKTPNVGIADVISDPAAADILKALIVTDAPANRPRRGPLRPEHRAREIVLLLRKPTNAAQVSAASAWIQVALNIADLLSRPIIKPEVQRKLIKTRADVDVNLTKAFKKEEEDYGEAEPTAEEKRAARKRAERAQLSEKELKKIEEKQKKREIRKLQKKGMPGAK